MIGASWARVLGAMHSFLEVNKSSSLSDGFRIIRCFLPSNKSKEYRTSCWNLPYPLFSTTLCASPAGIPRLHHTASDCAWLPSSRRQSVYQSFQLRKSEEYDNRPPNHRLTVESDITFHLLYRRVYTLCFVKNVVASISSYWKIAAEESNY